MKGETKFASDILYIATRVPFLTPSQRERERERERKRVREKESERKSVLFFLKHLIFPLDS